MEDKSLPENIFLDGNETTIYVRKSTKIGIWTHFFYSNPLELVETPFRVSTFTTFVYSWVLPSLPSSSLSLCLFYLSFLSLYFFTFLLSFLLSISRSFSHCPLSFRCWSSIWFGFKRAVFYKIIFAGDLIGHLRLSLLVTVSTSFTVLTGPVDIDSFAMLTLTKRVQADQEVAEIQVGKKKIEKQVEGWKGFQRERKRRIKTKRKKRLCRSNVTRTGEKGIQVNFIYIKHQLIHSTRTGFELARNLHNKDPLNFGRIFTAGRAIAEKAQSCG